MGLPIAALNDLIQLSLPELSRLERDAPMITISNEVELCDLFQHVALCLEPEKKVLVLMHLKDLREVLGVK